MRHVLLVTDELATTRAVATALESNGRLPAEDVCRDLESLVGRLERSPAPAVLVDIDPQPARMLAHLEPLIRRFPDTRFLLLSHELQPQLLLEAMQIGVRHALLKQSIPTDLISAIHRVCPPSSARKGHLITVLSASGGCGATTVAVNLANELQLHTTESALLVDLDCAYSTIPSYLGLHGNYGILDLLARTGPVDSELLHTTALQFSERLHVLTTTSTSRFPDTLLQPSDRLSQTLEACKQAYRFTVIDAPRATMDVAAVLAKASALVLVVFQLTVKDIRVVKMTSSALFDRGIPDAVIMPVLNRYRKHGQMIDPAEAQRVLGKTSLEALANDFPAASQAVNYGQPLSQAAPRSSLRRDLQRLAIRLSQELATAAKEA